MNIAFYSAAAGLISQQDGLNIYSNNIANVNTVGFKSLRPSFADCIYTIQRETEPDWQTGHGQHVMKTDFLWEEGLLKESEDPLDFALPNSNFFMVQDRDGNRFLTRDGSFAISNTGENWELVNANGDFVLNAEGERIQIPFKQNEEGEATNEILYDEITGLIGVYSVPNNWGLEQASNNHFAITERSGEPVAEPDADILRMALEMSTVDLAGEMVHMIEVQRSYQLNAKIIQTSDEFERIANNLRA